MASTSIALYTSNISAPTTVGVSTLSLTTSGTLMINVAGFLGWGFDIDISSTSASGTLYVYGQYKYPVDDTGVYPALQTFPVSTGTFGGSPAVTKQVIDSNNVTTKGWILVKWVGTDASNGTITISGICNT